MNSSSPIDNLDLISFEDGRAFPQGFQIDVACGRVQIFTQLGAFALSFDQEDLP